MQDSVVLLLVLCVLCTVGYILGGPPTTEGFAPYGFPTLEPSQPSSPADSVDYSACLADGYTRSYCQQQISADSCLCSNGSVGKRLPGYRGACVCDPQEIQKYEQENQVLENGDKICLTPEELKTFHPYGAESPRNILEKIQSQLPFNPTPHTDSMLNAMF